MAVNQVKASVRYTYDFVRGSLPDGAKRVLEIGCGSGELAAMLQGDGLEVIAVDSDPGQVELAKTVGVPARLMTWPGGVDGRFDAILFTRSLHHVDDLSGSVEAARAVLQPGGRIIVEDFRAEGGSQRSAQWFSGTAAMLLASGALSPDATLAELEHKAAPSDHHDHHLHSSSEITQALAGFDSLTEADAAYYFRYIEPYCLQQGAAQALLEAETKLIEQGSIDALGKRFVAGLG